jgi:hypothetical protein
VLSIGAFPEATNAELAERFAVTHYLQRPAPDALSLVASRPLVSTAVQQVSINQPLLFLSRLYTSTAVYYYQGFKRG